MQLCCEPRLACRVALVRPAPSRCVFTAGNVRCVWKKHTPECGPFARYARQTIRTQLSSPWSCWRRLCRATRLTWSPSRVPASERHQRRRRLCLWGSETGRLMFTAARTYGARAVGVGVELADSAWVARRHSIAVESRCSPGRLFTSVERWAHRYAGLARGRGSSTVDSATLSDTQSEPEDPGPAPGF